MEGQQQFIVVSNGSVHGAQQTLHTISVGCFQPFCVTNDRRTLNSVAKRKVVAIHIDPRSVGGASKLQSLPELSADAGHELPTCKPLIAALALAEVSLPSEIISAKGFTQSFSFWTGSCVTDLRVHNLQRAK